MQLPHLTAPALLTCFAGALIALAAGFSTGCTPTGAAGDEDADSFEAVKDIHGGPFSDMMLVYLKTGPTSTTQTKEEAAEHFKGHMANMQRLADAGILLIGGPFGKPRDKNWRGIFVLDTSSVQLAKLQAESDPAIKAGVFVAQYQPIKASIALRSTGDLEKAMKEAMANEATAGEAEKKDATKPAMPAGIRPYVMITADNMNAAKGALAKSGLAEKIVWCAQFSNKGDKGAVVVVDAEKVEDVQAALDKAGVSAGLGLDGWWSTKSLTGLEPAARKLP